MKSPASSWLLLCITYSLLLVGCKKESPPEPPSARSIELTLEDTSCTEAWLRVKLVGVAPPQTVQLIRLDSIPLTVQTIQILTSDSVLVDKGLAPRTTYTYKAFRLCDSRPVDSSTLVPVTTMDTTSHDFRWEIDTLGDGNSSVLHDVAIINDTLAYAVGEMYLTDSSGVLDPVLYNLAVWNGVSWRIQRVPYMSGGSPFYRPIKWVFALSKNDIWFENSTHWDGHQFHNADIATSIFYGIGSNRMWGGPTGQLYVVGNAGTVAYSPDHGSTWQRIESGTTLPFMDVYGARRSNGEYQILAVAEAYGTPGGSKIFSLEGNTAQEVTANGLESWGVEGIWFIPDRQYIAVGQGVWKAPSPSGTWYPDNNLPNIATTSVSGVKLNDISVCGAFWLLAHWNGVSWRTYFPRTSGALGGVAVKGNLLVAVGFVGDRAVALRATR